MSPDQHNSPRTIAARRSRALMIVRIIALALLLGAAICTCHTLGMMLVLGNVRGPIITIWNGTSYFAWGVGMLAPALALLMFDRRITRWLIPVPRRECHECGYPLRGLSPASTRCPECGTAIPAHLPSVNTPQRT